MNYEGCRTEEKLEKITGLKSLLVFLSKFRWIYWKNQANKINTENPWNCEGKLSNHFQKSKDPTIEKLSNFVILMSNWFLIFSRSVYGLREIHYWVWKYMYIKYIYWFHVSIITDRSILLIMVGWHWQVGVALMASLHNVVYRM